MSKSFKMMFLVVAAGICCLFLLTLPVRTLRSHVAHAKYVKNPTEEMRIAAETVEREDRRNMIVLRVLFGLALVLDMCLILRVVKGKGEQPTLIKPVGAREKKP